MLFHERPTAQIHIGSIGWEEDTDDSYYFLGDDTNDGHTLIRVQLFDGRDIGKPLSPTRAQGTKLLCHMSGGLFRIPPKDTRCYVAIPAGMEQAPGAGIIMATVERTVDGRLNKDRAVLDYGENTHLIIKAKSVSLSDYEDQFLTVGQPRSGGTSGIIFQASDGSGGVIQEGVVSWFVASAGDVKCMIQMTPTKFEVLHKVSLIASNIFKMENAGFSLAGPGTGFIMPATLVLGPTGSGAPPYVAVNTPAKISGCVFVSQDSP